MFIATVFEILRSQPAWLLAIVFVCLYCVAVALYRLYLSPLAKFPGPKLAALTSWVEFYHDVIRRGQYTFEIIKMHEKYGPIVRIAPGELHINDPTYYEELYPGWHKITDKPRSVAEQFGNSLGAVGTASHHLHKMRKDAMSAFFSTRSVMSSAHSIQSCVDKLCSRLEEYHTSQRSINLRVIFGALTIDIISIFGYGRSYNCLEKSDFDRDLYQLMASGGELALLLKQCPWVFQIANLLPYSFVAQFDPKILLAVKRKEEIEAQVRAILIDNNGDQKQHGPPDIFQEILNSDLPDEEKSIARMADEGIAILGAGTVTTSHNLVTTVYHILANLDILQAIEKEIDGVISKEISAQALLARLEQLPYLTASIKEGLRISNVSSHRNIRIGVNRSLKFGEWIIPPGVSCGMTPLMTHMDADIFPDPQEFRPERWFGNDSLKRFFVPFGRGTRSCLGMNLAFAQTYLTLAALFHRFELRFFETTRADVDVVHDFIGGFPRSDSKGVRVTVHRKLT